MTQTLDRRGSCSLPLCIAFLSSMALPSGLHPGFLLDLSVRVSFSLLTPFEVKNCHTASAKASCILSLILLYSDVACPMFRKLESGEMARGRGSGGMLGPRLERELMGLNFAAFLPPQNVFLSLQCC